MNAARWQTALAVAVVVVVVAVLMETAPRLGGVLLALLTFVLLSHGLKARTIHSIT